jgi:ABC-2 type transport system ATP-binding protein
VHDNEVVGLLGPNGSGKTTILRLLTGYLRPDAGTVRVDGFDVVHEGLAARARIGYVPEDAPLYAHMRVDEFLSFMGRLRGLHGPALQRAMELARTRLSLTAVAGTVIGRLSRGYRQRVSLAQAVLHQPKVLVLDEPTNGLDPRQIVELRGLVRSLAQHCAVLVTSHNLAETERIADRVAILLGGRLLAVHHVEQGAPGGSIRLRAQADAAPRIRAILAAMPGIADLTQDSVRDGTVGWHLTAADPDAASRLADRLRAEGIATVETRETVSDLESLFLRLTADKASA